MAWALGFVALTGAAHADSTHGKGSAQAPVQAAADQSVTQPDAHGGTSGDVTEPQPISRADANSGGANGQCPGGPYCSTRDGSASGNGNGGGQAVGKPCAGCVGKADNKNPRGQMPGPSDRNAGFKCDTNHGIARGNPAHSRCLGSPSECVPTPTVPCVPEQGCVPTPTVPCVPEQGCAPTPTVPCVPDTGCPPATLVAARCGPTSSLVSPVLESQSAVEAPTVAPAPSSRAAGRPAAGLLPNTGAPGQLVAWALAGLGSVACGASVLARRKRLQVRSTS